MRAVVTTAIVLVLAAAASAGVKVDHIGGGAAAASRQYSVDLHDLDLAALVEGFRKQTGIVVAADPRETQRDFGPTIVYDLSFKDLDRDAALRELGRATSMGLQRDGTGLVRLASNYQGEGPPLPPARGGVQVVWVQRSASIPAASSAEPDAVEVRLRVWGGGRVIAGPVRVDVTRAVDDQGRVLIPLDRNTGYTLPNADRSYEDVSVRLQTAGSASKRLAGFAGTVALQRPAATVRVTVDAFDDGPMTADLDGGTITVGPLDAPTAGGYPLPITITRGSMNDPQWEAILRGLEHNGRAMTATGLHGEPVRLLLRSVAGNPDVIPIRATLAVPNSPFRFIRQAATRAATRPSLAATRPTTRPAGFRWDLAAQTAEETVPFDFKDVAIP